MKQDDDFIAEARAANEAHRADLAREMAQDRVRRVRSRGILRWLFGDILEEIGMFLVAAIVVGAMGVVALSHALEMSISASTFVVLPALILLLLAVHMLK